MKNRSDKFPFKYATCYVCGIEKNYTGSELVQEAEPIDEDGSFLEYEGKRLFLCDDCLKTEKGRFAVTKLLKEDRIIQNKNFAKDLMDLMLEK